MVASIYEKLSTKVVATLEKYGRDVTFHVSSGGTVNASAGRIDGATITDYTVKASPPEQRNAFGAKVIAVEGRARITIAGKDLAFTPASGQRVTIDGPDWTVVGVSPLGANGALVVGWEIEVER